MVAFLGENANHKWTTMLFSQSELYFRRWNKYDFTVFLFITVAISIAVSRTINRLVKFTLDKLKILQIRKVPKSFKEPFPFPVIGGLLRLLWNRNDLPNFLNNMVAKYGPAIRVNILGKTLVLLNDPAMIQTLLMSNDHSHLTKPEFFYRVAFTDELSKGLVSSKPNIWKGHRSILSKAFTYEALKSYLYIFSQHCHKLVTDFQESLDSEGKDFTFFSRLPVSLFGTISHIVTGTDIVTDKECSKFYENFHRCQEIAIYRLYRPWFLTNPIWNLHPMKKELDSCIKDIDRDIRNLVKRHRESNESEKSFTSMMDVMLAANMPEQEILVEMTTLLIAGHDTTSVSLNFLMINLALHPNHQQLCREEVDKMFDILSRNEESLKNEVTIDSLSELKYLERCIKESLRLFPSIPLLCRELTSPLKFGDDLELGSGVTVVLSPWILHRSPEYYPKPETFDPDRFLPENCRGRSNYAYMPFSNGPRNCIGWKLAMLEMKIVTAYILRHFEVYTSDTVKDVERLRFSIVLSTEKKINVFLRRREGI